MDNYGEGLSLVTWDQRWPRSLFLESYYLHLRTMYLENVKIMYNVGRKETIILLCIKLVLVLYLFT
jgi:hypothetical protein